MATLSEHVFAQRIVNSKECEYLHAIIDKELRTVILKEYGLNCPPLVSKLITELAHNNDELRLVFQNKLFYGHFMKIYAKNARFNTRLNIFHTVSVSLIFIDHTLAAFQYLYNVHPIRPITCLIGICNNFLYDFLFKSIQMNQYVLGCAKSLSEGNTYFKFSKKMKKYIRSYQSTNSPNIFSPLRLTKRKKIKRVLDYYKPLRWRVYRKFATPAALSWIQDMSTLFPRFSKLWTSMKISQLSTNLIFGKELTQRNFIFSHYPRTLLLDPINGSAMHSLLKLLVTLKMQVFGYIHDGFPSMGQAAISILYLVARMGTMYPMTAQFVDVYAPSFWLHFRRWPYFDTVNQVSVGLLVFTNFAYLGCESMMVNDWVINVDDKKKKRRKKKLQLRQSRVKSNFEYRNLFEIIYHLVNLIDF